MGASTERVCHTQVDTELAGSYREVVEVWKIRSRKCNSAEEVLAVSLDSRVVVVAAVLRNRRDSAAGMARNRVPGDTAVEGRKKKAVAQVDNGSGQIARMIELDLEEALAVNHSQL